MGYDCYNFSPPTVKDDSLEQEGLIAPLVSDITHFFCTLFAFPNHWKCPGNLTSFDDPSTEYFFAEALFWSHSLFFRHLYSA